MRPTGDPCSWRRPARQRRARGTPCSARTIRCVCSPATEPCDIDRMQVDGPVVAIDASSSVPAFEQVRGQLATQISSGVLPAGTRLPTVRALAAELGLAVNTVARSYKELEAAGLVTTRARAGTVVSAAGDRSRETLQRAARHYADQARALGIEDGEALAMIGAALRAGGEATSMGRTGFEGTGG